MSGFEKENGVVIKSLLKERVCTAMISVIERARAFEGNNRKGDTG